MRSPNGTTFVSEPELSRMDDLDFVSSRKRKAHPDMEEILQLRTDIQEMFKSFKEDQDLKFSNLNKVISELKDQNKENIASNENLKRTLEDNLGLYKDLKLKYDALLLMNNSALDKIGYLEDQVEALQRKHLETTIEIKNVPITENENLIKVVNQLHTSLNIDFSPDQVRQVYRKKFGNHKTIFVEYQTIQMRAKTLKAIKSYNINNKQDKYNTKALKMPGDTEPVYISEALTPTARKLLFQSKELKKKYDFKFCWVSNGRIFLKKAEDKSAILIKSTEQIEGIINDITNPCPEV